MYSYNPYYANYLAHFGIKRKSGRYPYGSGDRPHQHDRVSKKIAKVQNKINKYEKKYYDEFEKNGYNDAAQKINKQYHDYLRKVNKRYGKILATELEVQDYKDPFTGNASSKIHYNVMGIDSYNEKKQSEKKKQEENIERCKKVFSQDPSYKEESWFDGEVHYSKKIGNDCILNAYVDEVDSKTSANDFKKYSDNIAKNYDRINYKAAEKIANDLYDTGVFDGWNSETKFENMSRQDFVKYLTKQGPSSITVSPNKTGEIWYQDGKKNDMDMFGDHSIIVDYRGDDYKMDRQRAYLAG